MEEAKMAVKGVVRFEKRGGGRDNGGTLGRRDRMSGKDKRRRSKGRNQMAFIPVLLLSSRWLGGSTAFPCPSNLKSHDGPACALNLGRIGPSSMEEGTAIANSPSFRSTLRQKSSGIKNEQITRKLPLKSNNHGSHVVWITNV